jgi:MYXO-CTERM domain-containing protein
MDCVTPEGYCSAEGVCLECLEDAHCSADEPLCLTAPGVGECVACIIDEDCSGDTPWCKGSNTCVECLDHADCSEEQHCSQDACVPDICEPGALSCRDDLEWVIQCDEFGAYASTVEHCPDADCEDGACGGSAGTSSEDTGADTSEGQEDTTGDPGAASPDGRGCSCNLGGEGAPRGVMGLVLLLVFGLRSRRRP